MTLEAIVSALLVFAGIGVVAAGLSRWGRSGTPPRRVGGLVLIGSGAMVAGGVTMADGSTAGYIVAGIVAGAGAILLATGASRPARRLPRQRRRR